MSFQVHRDDTGLWVVTAPSGQVFGVFTNEAEAGDAAEFLARVRGLGSLGAVEIPRMDNAALTALRAPGERRPAPQGTDRCTECHYLMRKKTECPMPGWRSRGSGGMCRVCLAREKRAMANTEDNTPIPVDNPVLVEISRERAARAERKARAERAQMLDYARRLAVKRRAS